MKPVIAFIAVALLLPSMAAAQPTNEGSVRGYVKDAHGAVLPGVKLSAASDDSPLPRSAVSDATGYYRLDNLLPATYTVTAELQGFSKYVRGGVLVRAGLNLGLDVVLAVGSMTETVDVKAETPMLETTNSLQSVNISGEFLRQVPISTRRAWSDSINLTPGVTSVDGGIFAARYYLRGANYASMGITLDGADVTAGQQAANSYVNLSTEALEDTQAKIGAVDASTPLALGVVVNMVTKSGTNNLRGSATLVYQGDDWNANNVTGGTAAKVALTQPEVSLGGPILKDRLWFFGAYRYQRRTTGVFRTAAQVANLKALYPAFEEFDSENFAHYSFVKGTARLGPRHQMSGSYQRDKSPSQDITMFDTEPFNEGVSGGPAWGVNLASVWSSSWLTRLSASYNAKQFHREVRPDRPGRQVYQSVFRSGARLNGVNQIGNLDNGNNGNGFYQPYWKYNVAGDATYHRTGWGGSHEAKVGFYFQPKMHSESNQTIANGGFGREQMVLRDANNPAGGFVPYYRLIYDAGSVVLLDHDTSDYAFYVQDNWRPLPRLTVNAGLRVDLIRRVDNIFDVETQNSTEVGPRLGFNYVLTSDGRNAVHGSWVRVHETLQVGVVSAGSNSIGIRELFDLDLDGTFETVLPIPASTALSANRIFDPDRHQPFADEWIVGYRRQFPGQLSVSASFTQRDYKDLTAGIDVNGIYEDSVFRGYRDPTQNEILLTTNNSYNSRVFRGFDIQVAKQTRDLQLLASYGRQWRHVSGTWQPNDAASFIQPDAFPNDKGIGSTGGTGGDSLSGNHMAGSENWRDHVFRSGVSYQAPWHLRFATNYNVQSGMWSGPIVTRIAASDPRFGPPTVTLSNGRVVANPLATTIRYAFATRGEGQFTTPVVHSWNVRVGRDFTIGRQRLEAAVDVFNVLNLDGDFIMLFGGNQQYNTTSYQKYSERQPPRSVQLYLRYAF